MVIVSAIGNNDLQFEFQAGISELTGEECTKYDKKQIGVGDYAPKLTFYSHFTTVSSEVN